MIVLAMAMLPLMASLCPAYGQKQQSPAKNKQPDTKNVANPSLSSAPSATVPCQVSKAGSDDTNNKADKVPKNVWKEAFAPPTWSQWSLLLVAGIAAWIYWHTLKGTRKAADATRDSADTARDTVRIMQKQLVSMKESGEQTNKLITQNAAQAAALTIAANAAEKSAEANRETATVSRLAMIAGDRAYVHQDGFNWISHPNSNSLGYFWRIYALWINSGNTPTRNLKVWCSYEIRDSPLPEDFKFPEPPNLKCIPTTISPKGKIASLPLAIDGLILAEVANRKKYFYIWGIATYRDVFPDTAEHITKFCCYAGDISGDPTMPFNQATNPVNISFPMYDKHNCADEECK